MVCAGSGTTPLLVHAIRTASRHEAASDGRGAYVRPIHARAHLLVVVGLTGTRDVTCAGRDPMDSLSEPAVMKGPAFRAFPRLPVAMNENNPLLMYLGRR